MKIAEITRRQVLGKNIAHDKTVAALFFDQWRELYNGFHEHNLGCLVHASYAPDSFYVRIDAAVGKVRNTFGEAVFSRVQTDDLLFTVGYSPVHAGKVNITFSGLLGIPTHKQTALEGAEFGVGHVGIGGQLDAAWHYNDSSVIYWATRYLRFFDRKEKITLFGKLLDFNITAGNAIDFFVAHATTFKKRHNLEFGYNPTFAFGVDIRPFIPGFSHAAEFIRSSFYGSYTYAIKKGKAIYGGILALSYGFDHRPKDVGIKRGIGLVASLGVNF